MTEFYTNIKQYGNQLLYTGYANGKRVVKRVDFKPTLFTKDNSGKEAQFHSYNGVPVAPVNFDSIKEARDFIGTYKGVPNFQIYGTNKFACEYVTRSFPKELKYDFSLLRIFYLDIETDSSKKFPEPEVADEMITAITIFDNKTKKFITWGLKDYDTSGSVYTDENPDPIKPIRKKIEYRKFASEREMLEDFVLFWSMNYPDIVTGWNSRFYDVPYIINRLTRLFGEKFTNKLSPWGIINKKQVNVYRFGQQNKQDQWEIYGIAELDLMDLRMKYEKKLESNSLAYVAKHYLKISKLEYDGTLAELYERDPQRFIDYNLQDVNLLIMLNDQLRLLELIVEVSYIGHVPVYSDSLGTVDFWEKLIYSHLYYDGMVTELKSGIGDKDEKYEGAFVKEPRVGRFDWVLSFDYTSLYPMTIRQVNIGTETYVDTEDSIFEDMLSTVSVEALLNKSVDVSLLKKHNLSLSANGCLYRREHNSFLNRYVTELFEKRKLHKKQMLFAKKEYEKTKDKDQKILAEMLNIKQNAEKTLINGVYGCLGNQYFQYFRIDDAEAVTVTGKVVILYTEKKVNQYLGKLLNMHGEDFIIGIDTDSMYINLGPLVEKLFPNEQNKEKIVNFLDKFAKDKLTPVIKQANDEMFDYMNHKDNLMDMKQEKIIERGIWMAKKRYCISVWDSEGVRYKEPDISVTGIKSVSSSTPGVVRTALNDCIKIFLTGTEEQLQDYISKYEKKFEKYSIEEIAFPQGVNDVGGHESETVWYKKGTPIYSKASIVYNKMVDKYDLGKTYQKITDGTQIKWLYLTEDNPIEEEVIGFIDKFPKQFKLENFVDRQQQYEKAFLKPVTDLCNLSGWKPKKEKQRGSLF